MKLGTVLLREQVLFFGDSVVRDFCVFGIEFYPYPISVVALSDECGGSCS